MVRYSHTVIIECEPAALFAVLMDPSANRRWQTGVVATRATGGGAAHVGMTMSETREFAGYRTVIEYQLVAVDWPRRAVVELVDGPLRGTASYRCRAVPGGTELTVASDVSPQGRWRCFGRALGGLLTAELAVSCQRLKALLEQRAPETGVATRRVMAPA